MQFLVATLNQSKTVITGRGHSQSWSDDGAILLDYHKICFQATNIPQQSEFVPVLAHPATAGQQVSTRNQIDDSKRTRKVVYLTLE